eukprot:scaffold13501_cov303-Alexandrium_tamarense.AAC.1
MAHKKEGNFQLACTKHFEVMHPAATSVEGINLDGVGNHPNAWFSASVQYHNAKNGGGSGSAAAAGSNLLMAKKEEVVEGAL